MSIVLISGANEAIGNGFVKKYLARPHSTVIGTVRDPSATTTKALHDLPKAEGSRIIVVKIESTSETDALEATKGLSAHNIDHIDIVVANAGIFSLSTFQKVSEMKTSDLLHHCDINVAGTIRLFEAVLPLLEKAALPKFMAVSSVVATNTGMEGVPFTVSSYVASKAALSFLVRRIHCENEGLIAFAVQPRAVQTDEGNAADGFFGVPQAFVTVLESVDGLVTKLDAATRKDIGGKFISFDDTPPA